MAKIRFTRDYQVKAKGNPKFKKGEEMYVSADSAKHFVDRDAAVIIADAPKKMKPREEPKPFVPGDTIEVAPKQEAATEKLEDVKEPDPPKPKRKYSSRSKK